MDAGGVSLMNLSAPAVRVPYLPQAVLTVLVWYRDSSTAMERKASWDTQLRLLWWLDSRGRCNIWHQLYPQ